MVFITRALSTDTPRGQERLHCVAWWELSKAWGGMEDLGWWDIQFLLVVEFWNMDKLKTYIMCSFVCVYLFYMCRFRILYTHVFHFEWRMSIALIFYQTTAQWFTRLNMALEYHHQFHFELKDPVTNLSLLHFPKQSVKDEILYIIALWFGGLLRPQIQVFLCYKTCWCEGLGPILVSLLVLK